MVILQCVRVLLLALLMLAAGGNPTALAADQLALTATAVGNTSAMLSWNAPPQAVTYTVHAGRTVLVDPTTAMVPERRPGLDAHPLDWEPPGTWVLVAEGLRETSVTLADLPPEGTFAFLVRALDAEGDEVAASTVATVSLDQAPGGTLTFEVPVSGTIQLTWHQVPGAARYGVLVGLPGRLLMPDPFRQALTGTTTRIDGLPPGTTWRFAVEAQDERGGVLARTQAEVLTMPPPTAFGPP
jgi:hypothetical protein